MKTTKDMIEVMQAYDRGEQIEYCEREYPEHWDTCCFPPNWDWEHFNYRVKVTPTYRPYENAQEFLQAQKEHGMYLKYYKSKAYKLPLCVYDDSIEVKSEDNCGYTKGFMIQYATLSNYYLWHDNTPCGIKC